MRTIRLLLPLALGSVVLGFAACRERLDLPFGQPTPTPTTLPEDAVGGVRASAGMGSVRLDWPAEPAASFHVYFATDPAVSPQGHATLPGGGTAQNVVPPLVLTTSAHGLESGVRWYFVVTAVGTSGESAPSPWVSAVPIGMGWNGVGLDRDPATTLESPDGDDTARFGYPLLAAGDADQDGYGDVAIGAYEYSNGQDEEGALFVFRGGPDGLDPDPLWSAECNEVEARCGTAGAIGDFDDDGFDDVVVGASDRDGALPNEGGIMLYRGGAGNFGSTIVDTRESGQESAFAARHLANSGDVNGDGIDDLLVPIHSYSNGQSDEGVAVLLLGTATGISAVEAWAGESNDADAMFGWGVSTSRGDVDGDGFDDLLVGAPRWGGTESREGRAFLYRGATIPSGTAAWTAESGQANAELGRQVAFADVDGDGFSDVLVSVSRYDTAVDVDAGCVRLFHGSAAGLPAQPDWTKCGDAAGAWFGEALASAGDVNGDGFDDVLIGAFRFDGDFTDEGRAELYLGGPAGLADEPVWTRRGGAASLFFGGSLGRAGDVNGDGKDDVLVGPQDYVEVPLPKGYASLFLSPPDEGPALALPARIAATSGQPIALSSAAFTDPSPTTAHTCHVDWGDGTAEVAIDPCTETGLAAATHTYGSAGRRAIRVRVLNGYSLEAQAVTIADTSAP